MINNAAEAYKRQQVMTATPEALTLMLYNGALRFMKEGLEAMTTPVNNFNLIHISISFRYFYIYTAIS